MILEARGRQLFYDAVGGGALMPLVLMHGGMGLDHTYLRPWLDPLGRDRLLIYYDHFGNGRSLAASAADQSISIDALIADAEALRAHFDLDRMVVLAHSAGTCVAVEYALAYPDRIAGLILSNGVASPAFGPALMAEADARASDEVRLAFHALFAGAFSTDDELERLIRTVLPLYFHRFEESHRSVVDRMIFRAAAFKRFAVEGLAQYRPRLSEVATPTLVVTGASDWIPPGEYGSARLHEEVPRAELQVFEHSGHLPFIEEPDRFVATVARWLTGIDAGDGRAG